MSKGYSNLFDTSKALSSDEARFSPKGGGKKAVWVLDDEARSRIPPIKSRLSRYQRGLILQVKAKGYRISSGKVLAIGRRKDGKIIWIETGNDSTGLQHIIQAHGHEFTSHGISLDSIPSYVLRVALRGKVVGYMKTSNPLPREVYRVRINGKVKYVAISVSDNGYIVGAQFVEKERIKWK